MTKSLNALLKAAAIPVCWWAAAVSSLAGWGMNPAWHRPSYTGEDSILNGLMVLAYGGLLVGTVTGWLLLRQWVQSRMALVLLVPYLALIVAGVVAVVFVGLALAGGP